MERIKSIDVSKGISIILMTFSHLLVIKKHPELTELNIHYFMIFKMPLFIIISGILYSSKKNLKDFIISKSESLLKPALSAIFLCFLIAILIMGLNDPVQINIKNALAKTILFVFPLWFIFSLFLSLAIFRFFFYILALKDDRFKYVIIISIVLILSLLSTYGFRYYFVNLSTIIYFVVYLFIGYTIKKNDLLKYLISKTVFITSIIIFATFVLLKQKIDINLSLTNNIFTPFFLTLLYSIVGSIMILNLSNVIGKQKWIAHFFILCGRSSFFILSFHIILGNYLIPELFPKNCQNYFFDFLALLLTIVGCILIKEACAKTRLTRYLFLPKQNK